MSDIQVVLGVTGTLTPKVYSIQGSLTNNTINIRGSLTNNDNCIESTLSQKGTNLVSSLGEKLELQCTINQVRENIVGSISGTENLSSYQGKYKVIPLPNEQVELNTKGYIMLNNITVTKIPYESVSNLSGGLTITIGGK